MRGHAQYTAATSRQQETLPPPISDAVATRSNSRFQPGMDKMKSKYFLGLMALACADSSGPTQIPITATGAIQIVVATTSAGADVDADGYTLSIDAAQPQFIADNATMTVEGLKKGVHVVLLGGLASNCAVAGTNPLSIEVDDVNTPTRVSFSVQCRVKAGPCPSCANSAFVYVRGSGVTADLYVVSAAGGVGQQLTSSPGWDGDPAWSPDHSKIAFATDRDGNREIYVMNSDGTNPVRLTNDGAADYGPAWSPDGRRIAFVSERTGTSHIYAMDADGSDLKLLTNGIQPDREPDWSPDGKRIAFLRENWDWDNPGGICVMDASGANVTQLTWNPRGDSQPVWSPDGRKIAYARVTYYTTDIYAKDADGTGNTPLTLDLEYASNPSWSPDGLNIAFSSVAGDEYSNDSEIIIVGIDGSRSASVTPLKPAFNAAWR